MAAALDEQFAAWDSQWAPAGLGGEAAVSAATSRSLEDPFATARLDEQFELWAASHSLECTPSLQPPSPRTRGRSAAFRSAPLGVHVPVITSVAPEHLRPVRRALFHINDHIKPEGQAPGSEASE